MPAANFLRAPSPVDLLQKAQPNPEKVGARFRAPRGFPAVVLRSAHVLTDTPVWLTIGCFDPSVEALADKSARKDYGAASDKFGTIIIRMTA